MVDDLWRSEPKVGDVLKTRPVRVSNANKIIGKTNVDWVSKVIIEKKNLETMFSDEMVESINKNKGFRIRQQSQYWPAEIVRIESRPRTAYVEILKKEDGNEQGEKTIFESKNREEPIEWEGTEQKINDEKIKDRNEVFNEGDRRGSKNDLLDGNL